MTVCQIAASQESAPNKAVLLGTCAMNVAAPLMMLKQKDDFKPEQLAANGQLRTLVRRAVNSQDNCLLKLVRNISAHNLPYREEFREYVDEMHMRRKALMRLLKRSQVT